MTQATETPAAPLSAEELDKLEARTKEEKGEGYALMAIKHNVVLDLIAQARLAAQPVSPAWDAQQVERIVGDQDKVVLLKIVADLDWTVNGTWVITKSGEKLHTLDALAFARTVRAALAAPVAAQADITEPSTVAAPSAEQAEDIRVARHAVFNLKEFRAGHSTFPGEALGILEGVLDRIESGAGANTKHPPPTTSAGRRMQQVDNPLASKTYDYVNKLVADQFSATSAGEADTTAPAAQAASFQQRVEPWMAACFGPRISADTSERNHRFFEEATELVQAGGMPKADALLLVDYVYGRPVGELGQEIGGVMVTLAALCLANRVDMHQEAETELARIWTKVEAIRAKQASKPKGSALPAPVAAAAPVSQAVEQPADDAEDAARYRAWRGAMVTEDEDFYIEVMARLPASKEPPKPEAVDAAIDAAMSATKQEGDK